MEIIQAGKTTGIPFCTEITVLGGVTFPDTIRVFDVRVPESEVFNFKTPWGSRPLSSERAEIVLGLRGPGLWESTSPRSCQAYEDFRKASESKLASIARDMLKMFDEYLAEYQSALANPAKPGEGGSVYYKPIAMTLANFGWGLTCDQRIKAVRGFD